ncbi:NAD(P)-binding protein [Chromobacterium violaceum]|uniref:NAD(P)-binding protein n=1 Tax=Chromobacterium violaceum TaxID=536 RepID=UPI001CAABDF5|nr:NAD(P)-binding protein [Chromobacterium violaceum]STB71072.1 Protoporphyrinogen oxidase [Chromobacterium violaceum]
MSAKPVIVGGGPAGMSAAMELARHGVECVLLDEASRVGGVVYRGPLREGVVLDYLGERYRENMQALHREFEQVRDRIDIRLNTRVVGGGEGELFALTPDERVEAVPFPSCCWPPAAMSAACPSPAGPCPA